MFEKIFGKQIVVIFLILVLVASMLFILVGYLPPSFGLKEVVELCFGGCVSATQYTELGHQLNSIFIYTNLLCLVYFFAWAIYRAAVGISNRLLKK